MIKKRVYRDFDKVREKVEEFIDEHNRFPKYKELNRVLNIDGRIIRFHGGINSIKSKMKYVDDNDYVDDDGFNNMSLAEYITSQYLIANEVSCLREQYPFHDSENKYRSDFLIRTVDGEDIHIEVWGYSLTAKDEMSVQYNETRKKKEELYNKYNYKLISIEGVYLSDVTYKEKQEYLKEKFKDIVNKELIIFDDIIFLHPNRLTDKEILDILMRYSDDEDTLPLQDKIKEVKMNRYLIEIRKRYDSYYDFAKKFDKNLNVQHIVWDTDEIYKAFRDIVSNGYPITKNTIEEFNYVGMFSKLRSIYNDSGITTAKLEFYKDYLQGIMKIHEEDIASIYNISKNRPKTSEKITKLDMELASFIITLIMNSEYSDKLKDIIAIEDIRYTPKIELQKQEYIEYFNSLNLKGNDLYPTNFNNISKHSTKSYLKTFKMSWVELMDLFDKKNELISIMEYDFLKKCEIDNKQNLGEFLKNIGIDYRNTPYEIKNHFWELVNSNKTKIQDVSTLDDNFYTIKNKFGYNPFLNEFKKHSNHTVSTYSKHLGIANSYDEIVKYYSSDEEYQEYLQRKRKHRSDISRITANPSNKFTEEHLESEFKKAYDSYFLEYGKYPSMRKFNEISKVDESVYRKRFKMKFSEVSKMYGY